jgi:hypothetical protein
LLPGERDQIQNLPSRIRNIDQWQDWRRSLRNGVRDYWEQHGDDYDEWFADDWWNNHHIEYPYYSGFDYWAWAAWNGVADWVDNDWNKPIYYYYGDNVYYQDGSVYYGDEPVATEEEYAQQAEAIAIDIPKAKPNDKDWMPLGVFAMSSDGEPTGAEPTMYLQLAVTKQGIINGTFQNVATDVVQPIEGMVDKQTQRAAWTAKGKIRPLMETGIVNLTQDSSPALVHFADGTTQQWLLVRVKKPAGAEKSQAAQ